MYAVAFHSWLNPLAGWLLSDRVFGSVEAAEAFGLHQYGEYPFEFKVCSIPVLIEKTVSQN